MKHRTDRGCTSTAGSRGRWRALALGCVLVVVAGCGGGGGGSGDSGGLAVVSFSFADTDGVVYRNEPLVFEFSSKIHPEGVSALGLQVRRGIEVVRGRIEIDGRLVSWFPVVLDNDRNDYFPDNAPPLNGIGLEANERYSVRMIAGASGAIRSRNGRLLSVPFESTITTREDFRPENPEVPPVLFADRVEFDPAPIFAGNPFSPNPDDWPVVDPSEMSIRLRFSEPILPSSIDALESITLRNITQIPGVAPAGVGELALLQIIRSDTADELRLRNLVSLGDWPGTTEPYVFRLTITREISDLAGIPLSDAYVLHFKTADRPGEPNHAVITETFDTRDFEDVDATTGRWGEGGELRGADVNLRTDDYVPLPQSIFLLPQPLVQLNNPVTPRGNRFQIKIDTNRVPNLPGESIVGLAWSPRSDFGFFSVYRDVVMKLGFFPGGDLGLFDPIFDRNYQVPPVTVFRGDYTVPFALDAPWIDWPEFTTDFDLNIDLPLVMEWDMPEGGDTYQLFRNKSNFNATTDRQFANGGADRAITGRENTQYNTRFYLVSKRSFGQSLPIDTFLGKADFGAHLLQVDPDRAGTDVILTWAGSFGDPVEPDDFVDDLDELDGFTHFVFRAQLVANARTGEVPGVRSLSVAYVVP